MAVVLTNTVVEFTTVRGSAMLVEKGDDGKYTVYNQTTGICDIMTPEQIMKLMAVSIEDYRRQ